MMVLDTYHSSPVNGPLGTDSMNLHTPRHESRPAYWHAPRHDQYIQPPSNLHLQSSSPSGPWTSPYPPSVSSPLRDVQRENLFLRSPDEDSCKPWSSENDHWQSSTLQERANFFQIPFVSSVPSINHGQSSQQSNPFMPSHRPQYTSRYEAMAAQNNPSAEMHSRASMGRYLRKRDFQDRLRRGREQHRDDRIEQNVEKTDYLQARQAREAQLRQEAQMQGVNRQQLEAEAMAEVDEPIFDEDEEVNTLAEDYYKEQQRKREFIDLQKTFPNRTIEELEYLAALRFPMGYQDGDFEVSPKPGWRDGTLGAGIEKRVNPVPIQEHLPDHSDFEMEDDMAYEEAFRQAWDQQQG